MLAALLLIVCAIINIALIIALIWKMTSFMNDTLDKMKLPNTSYWEISNLIFLDKAVSSSPLLSSLVDNIKRNSDTNIIAGMRGLLWFILIQGILQVILAFAWPSIPSFNSYQAAGGRRR